MENDPMLGLDLFVFFLGLHHALAEQEPFEQIIADGLLQGLETEKGTMLFPAGQTSQRLNDIVIR